MQWEFQTACEGFDRYAEMWDEINRSQGNHILLDSKFVGPLVRYFGSSKTLLCLSNAQNNPCMALVERVGNGFWNTFQPSQGPLGLIVLANKEGTVEKIKGLLSCLPGYALGFSVLQQDPDFTVFGEVRNGPAVEILEYMKTSRLTVKGSFQDYWSSRGVDLTNNLARRRRKLERQGIQFELVAERDFGCVTEGIKEYGKLEGMGWKAQRGTAVKADDQQGLFYEEVLQNFCRGGEGVIYRLLFNGQTAASSLCLERSGMMVVLKIAYDPAFREFSPGFLLRQEIFRALFSEGKIGVVEFYGRLREGWTTKWTDEVRTMYHLNFYRQNWIPVAKRTFCRISRLLKSG